MKNKEIPTSLNFEIGEVTEVNEDISECEIRVFYHGKNRNGSYITKATGEELAKTLPRAPIVAFYNEEIADFEGHNEEIVIENDEVKFVTKTVPYGAIDKDTPLEWEKVVDENGEEKEYMVARGFLWTGRYPFLNDVIKSSKGQSMELFEDSVVGTWANLPNEEHDFFIINEARISALCILGDDVEPCFEDADIGAPRLNYSMEAEGFKKEFDDFMTELDAMLHGNDKEGGVSVKKEKFEDAGEDLKAAKEAVSKAEESKTEADVDSAKTKVNALEAGDDKDALLERLDKIEVTEEKEDPEGGDDTFEEANQEVEELTQELSELKESYELLKSELETVNEAFAVIEAEKAEREMAEKEDVLEQFSKLGEDVVEGFKEKLDEYSVEELEKELSVIAFQKGYTFNLLNEDKRIVTYNANKEQNSSPAWIKAIEKKQKSE